MSRLLSKSWTRSVEPVLRRLNAYVTLDEGETALLQRLDGRLEQFKPGAELTRAGGSAARPRFLLSGWACRQRVLPDGRRQIFEFLLPGDGLGFCGPHAPRALASTVAVTAVETIGADGVHEEILRQPSGELAKAMAAGISEQEGRLLDSLVRLGRQTAYERVAHLLLELHRRLSVVGLAYDQRFSMPLTQEVLADALGLSVVHVNRILQQLRREHLIELRAGGAILRAPEQLAIIADFRG
ncbi:MAG: transcriptional regulator, Crp/Fnr family [Phenylobacterium sp.]|jgi:CRP-like cAMP-binding protein|nr:transcriptional regulator, Crp/Fnr family [Phenylobacterium sp.]